ncbi:MAG: class II fructose-bisphosphatase [Nitrospinae bacterium]|nr:class II fructose-bisphosphatase [Nitrospinota bacterium]
MDRNLALEAVRVTEAAALASARLMGLGDEKKADQAAVDAMRKAFNGVKIKGTVVIGEGERDNAPMLYIGEEVGSGDSPEVDVALDPLEGTNICATGGPNAISVIAIGKKGSFLHAPDTYMEKIAVGPKAKGAINLNKSPSENLKAIAAAYNYYIEDLTVVILDRPRHENLIKEVRRCGSRIKLIKDGDVSAGMATAIPNSGVDVLMGIGGAPEGVLAAAALQCIGGDMQGRLKPQNDQEAKRAKDMGIKNLDKIFTIDELANGDDIMFAATGVTNGDLLKGVRFFSGGADTHSIVMRSKSRTIRFIEAKHHFDFKPDYNG